MKGAESVWLSELFVSIQGEGMLAGLPSTFIRTSGCNLRCVWCDTPETSWEPKGQRRSADSIVEEVHALGVRHVVLTGGEPLLSEGALQAARALRLLGHHLTIETAAAFSPSHFAVGAEADLFSISPKLRSSTPEGRFSVMHEERRWKPAWITALMQNEYQLKFVVAEQSDLRAVDEAVAELKPARERVLLMPEGTSAARLDEVGRWLAPACVERGYRFCDRLHVRLFGHTRGT